MKTYYAGIGSRSTPESVRPLIKEIATVLSNLGFICNSGGANGADQYFEDYAKEKQIFLPWNGFNGKKIDNVTYFVPEYDEELVRKFHPKFKSLRDGARKLMSRNSNQVMGLNLKTPVQFVICWTKSGKDEGGTAQACRIAHSKFIPVYNLNNSEDLFELLSMINNEVCYWS